MTLLTPTPNPIRIPNNMNTDFRNNSTELTWEYLHLHLRYDNKLRFFANPMRKKLAKFLISKVQECRVESVIWYSDICNRRCVGRRTVTIRMMYVICMNFNKRKGSREWSQSSLTAWANYTYFHLRASEFLTNRKMVIHDIELTEDLNAPFTRRQ
jgi:hypothetical protein